ncbi:MAG: DUF1343 domain-containing protein [Microbacteriaceae bacterium]|nr:DUF1343 domain-containing protein [Microbacteriaceae bacterium]
MTLSLGADRPEEIAALGLGRARIGLVTNDAALTSAAVPVRVVLLEAGHRIVRLFSPEHGLSAQGRDGAHQADGVDALTGLPVVSLYGERLAPRPEDLADLDAVIVDLPDVGCRFYTYPWTLSHVLESCALAGVPAVILDRPNPLGGDLRLAEGPMLDEARCASFVGRWTMPIRHGLTLGELAALWAGEGRASADVRIVPVRGWERASDADATRRPWVPTSPAMPSAMTAMLYPGTGLLEGVNCSDGRGTALPFRVVGAPWIDAGELWRALRRLEVPGFGVSPHGFVPADGRYPGEACQGVLLTVLDSRAFRPVAFGVELIRTIAALWPERLAEATYPTRANPSGAGHLDLLLGVPDALAAVRAGRVDTSLRDWAGHVEPYLQY